MNLSRKIAGGVALAGTAALLVSGAVGSVASGSEEEPISIAIVNGWDEGIAVSELWKHVLEEKGYEVELEYADVAAVYTGLSQGQYDLYLDTWLPTTHAQYIERYGDDLVDLGVWNDEATLSIAVNEDAPINTLSELAANPDVVGNRIVGIEAGSGIVTKTQEQVIPGYGLEDMELVLSSTPAMLTELETAIDAGENVAVTMWRPHWAYNTYPIKDLEDPEGLFGEAEQMHSFASTEFEGAQPEVHEWLTKFKMDNEKLYSLQQAMFADYDGDDYGPIIEKWVSENQEWVDGLTA